MRLSLADVKKRVARRGGELYLVPTLLRRNELLAEIASLIALYESALGQERRDFPADRPAELVGDYRLARALTLVLAEWYTWEPVPWPGPASALEAHALAEHAIGSPGELRLALYDAVNAEYGGFLTASEREPVLGAFADRLGIGWEALDALLALDDEERARLRRTAPAVAAPDPLAVLVRYNQRAVEALLRNASSVEWLLPPAFAAAQGSSLGTVLKRLCFLARTMGVLYDVSFAGPRSETEPIDLTSTQPRIPEERAPRTLARVAESAGAYAEQAPAPIASALDTADRALLVELYGPREVFGAANQYGDRLARVCRAWLGYAQEAQVASPAIRARRARERRQSSDAALRGTAHVALHGASMRFALDEAVLALLENSSAVPADQDLPAAGEPTFDSLLESRLYEEFSALVRTGQTFGWSIEREPEPLLAGDTILIADFAFARGGQRVFLEVAGFWTPDYRERKRRKLAVLAGRAHLIVAAPMDARSELAGLEALLPMVWFKGHVGAAAVLAVLRARFDDITRRRAAVPLAEVIAAVERRGVVVWEACEALLGAYGGSEIALLAGDVVASAQASGHTALIAKEGVGLMTAEWLDQVRRALGAWVAEASAASAPNATDEVSAASATLSAEEADAMAVGHPLTLSEAHRRLRQTIPGLEGPQVADSWIEGLVWAAGFAVARASLFEAVVVAPTSPRRVPRAPQAALSAQPRRPARRTQHGNATPSPQARISWGDSKMDP